MTQERERILQKIKRVQALAERGVAGEQESAAAERLEIQFDYDFFREALEEEMDRFFSAFLIKTGFSRRREKNRMNCRRRGKSAGKKP